MSTAGRWCFSGCGENCFRFFSLFIFFEHRKARFVSNRDDGFQASAVKQLEAEKRRSQGESQGRMALFLDSMNRPIADDPLFLPSFY